MSDVWMSDAQPAAVPADAVTAGSLLRQAREASGLHVAALAVALKVPVRKVEALEENRWDVLTDSVFVRALASSVCRTLKIDPQPVLDRLPRTPTPRLVQARDGINTPFHAPSDAAPPSWFDQLTRPVFLVVFAILLGALAIMLLPGQREAPPVAAMPVEPQPVLMPPPNPAPTMDVPPAVAISSAATVISGASGDAVPAAAPLAMAAAPGAPASGVVVFRTKGPSWIEVTDAKGAMVLRKQMESGDTAGASGSLPLRVTIGRVDHTQVQVRGKEFDLGPVSRDNVARFEVK